MSELRVGHAPGFEEHTLRQSALLVAASALFLLLGALYLTCARMHGPIAPELGSRPNRPSAKATPSTPTARGCPLSGRVVDPHGLPVAHAELLLERHALESATNEPAYASSPLPLVTDARGKFSAIVPERGLYTLLAWGPGFRPREIALELSESESSIPLTLMPYESPRGVVRDPEGHPVEGAYVLACPGDNAITLRSAANGTFALGPSAVGCRVTAHHPAYAHSSSVRVRASGWTELALQPGGAIEGVVTDASGNAVSEATLEVATFTPSESESPLEAARIERAPSAVTRAFRLSGLAPGIYTLRGTRVSPDYSTADTQELLVSGGTAVRGVHLVLE